MPWPELVAGGEVLDRLSRRWAEGRLLHAYLFVGETGLGQEQVAAALAAALLCPRPDAGGAPCGACHACRRVERRLHPDLHWLSAGGSSLGIGAVRGVLHALSRRPLEGSACVAVIEGAEALTTEAGNALLKLLEEPPGFARLFLLAGSAEALLPTLRSRCASEAFRPLPPEVLARRLEEEAGLATEEARLLAWVAGGNPGRVEEERRSGLWGRSWELAADLLAAVGSGEPLRWLQAAQRLEEAWREQERLPFGLRLVFRDLLLVTAGCPGLALRPEAGAELLERCPRGPRHWAGTLRLLEEAEGQARRHANRRLICEVLLTRCQHLWGSI